MRIELVAATGQDQETVRNLGRFYTYDMSRYCGFLPGWETPENGLFEDRDRTSYWEEAGRYPFLIRVDGELAGFALINKIGTTPAIDWHIGEFFVIAKFQRRGVGGEVAKQLFHRFTGRWEVDQIPENRAAIDFWERVVDTYTDGRFKKANKIIAQPKPHPMIVLEFDSPGQKPPLKVQ